jgi:hypothetical protein
VPDLCLDARRPFALITTVRRSGPRATCVHAQLDLAFPDTALRLRFADTRSLVSFVDALNDLVSTVIDHHTQGDPDVRVRVIQPGPVQVELPY